MPVPDGCRSAHEASGASPAELRQGLAGRRAARAGRRPARAHRPYGAPPAPRHAPLFTGLAEAPLRAGQVQWAWRQARRRAGLPDVHFHDLRQAGLTLSAQSGATLAEVMRRAGHASSAAALRYQMPRTGATRTSPSECRPSSARHARWRLGPPRQAASCWLRHVCGTRWSTGRRSSPRSPSHGRQRASALVAEADGNRTHQDRIPTLTGFEVHSPPSYAVRRGPRSSAAAAGFVLTRSLVVPLCAASSYVVRENLVKLEPLRRRSTVTRRTTRSRRTQPSRRRTPLRRQAWPHQSSQRGPCTRRR